MKPSTLLSVLLAATFAVSVSAQPTGKAEPEPKLKWRVQQLHQDNNEGLAIGDIDGDGLFDITAGTFWYQAPDWTQRPLRKLGAFGVDYTTNNGEHLYDMDGDGDLDVLAGTFKESIVYWYENPGPGKYDVESWTVHEWMDTGTGENEATFMEDIDGDGTPEFVENSWNVKNPAQFFRLNRGKDGKVTAAKHVIAEVGNGHGMGFGDINGDKTRDVAFQEGWYEQPLQNPLSTTWAYHDDFKLPHACCPFFILDLNEDGRNDIIWGDGHNYGLYWHEQLEPRSDGTTTWRQHLIDKTFSQAHALAWDDVDNDGKPELITGKRYYGHSGRDPGANDEVTVQYYNWNPGAGTWTRHLISQAPAGQGPGIGLQIRVHDLDGNGWKDVIVPGKSGTHILWNDGPSSPAGSSHAQAVFLP